MSFNEVPAIQCPKCGYEANTATALNCTVCTHPLRENIAPVRARQAFVGKGALSSKSLLLSRNPSTRKSAPVEKTSAFLRWIAFALPPLLLGVGYLLGSNSGPSKIYDNSSLNRIPPNNIPAPVNNVPAPSSKPSVNQSPRTTQTQRVEVPAKEPRAKPLAKSVSTKASKPSGKSVVTSQKKTPLLPSSVKSPVKAKSKVKPKDLTARPPSQTSQIVESQEPKPMANTSSAVVIDSSEANEGNSSMTSMDCYGGQSKQNYPCRNRKN